MDRVFVEGHRGYCAEYPENTLASYEAAMDLGVDGFEFDIWLSKDKVPVLMHDGVAFRTCGVQKHLRDMTLSEIKEMDAGFAGKFGDKFIGRGFKVPTLRELCELVHCKRPDLTLGVEIKEYTEECVDLSVAILKEYGFFDKAFFYAFDAPTIKYLKTKYNARTMGYPDFQMKRFDHTEGYRYYDEIGLSMTIARSEVAPIFFGKGMPVHLYCADTEEDVRFCLSHPECTLITANDPVPLMKVLGREPGKTTAPDTWQKKEATLSRFERIEKEGEKRILVASHRGGCGGNIPPNTLAAFEVGLRSGADIIECDLCRLADGTFVMFHPGTELESTSFAEGAISQMTWEELSKHFYYNCWRTKTQFPFCRLDDALEYMKGRCLINLDKAVDHYYEYLPEIVETVRRHGMTEQVIIKSNPRPHCFDAVETYAPDIKYMPVLKETDEVTDSLLKRNIRFYGAELVWANPESPFASREYVEKMHALGKKLWVNAIVYDCKKVLVGGHTDDLSLTTDPADHWGWMADMGYDIIQTDWPLQLKQYLEKSGKLQKQ